MALATVIPTSSPVTPSTVLGTEPVGCTCSLSWVLHMETPLPHPLPGIHASRSRSEGCGMGMGNAGSGWRLLGQHNLVPRESGKGKALPFHPSRKLIRRAN